MNLLEDEWDNIPMVALKLGWSVQWLSAEMKDFYNNCQKNLAGLRSTGQLPATVAPAKQRSSPLVLEFKDGDPHDLRSSLEQSLASPPRLLQSAPRSVQSQPEPDVEIEQIQSVVRLPQMELKHKVSRSRKKECDEETQGREDRLWRSKWCCGFICIGNCTR